MMPPNQLQNQLQAFGGAMINPVQGNFQPMTSYFSALGNPQPSQHQSSNPPRHQGGKMEKARQIIRSTPYQRRVNSKHKPRASELIKLPNPLPECIEQLTDGGSLYCTCCKLNVNSKAQLKQHLNSTKHKMIELGFVDNNQPGTAPKVGQYRCNKCDVMLNSEAQLMQHLGSLRHQSGGATNSVKSQPSTTSTADNLSPNASGLSPSGSSPNGSPPNHQNCREIIKREITPLNPDNSPL